MTVVVVVVVVWEREKQSRLQSLFPQTPAAAAAAALPMTLHPAESSQE
jgi:hypothetical protein